MVMFSTFKTAALSAVIGLGALAAVPATAQADSFHMKLGDARLGIHVGSEPVHWRGDHGRRGRDFRTCSPAEAVSKARRIGVRHARVVDVDRRTIDVAGRRYGHRVHMTFARYGRNCPIVRW
jgi:hypothetical protein